MKKRGRIKEIIFEEDKVIIKKKNVAAKEEKQNGGIGDKGLHVYWKILRGFFR